MTTTAMATASWHALGTRAVVRVSDRRHLKLATRMLQEELESIDLAASSFRDDSELARLLGATGNAVPVGAALRRAVLVALTAADLTDGLVDPTLGSNPGWRSVEVTDSTVRVPGGATLDLGATGKALAADRAAAAISVATDGAGVLVSLGGDISTAGDSPSDGWSIHVTDDHRSTQAAPGQTVTIRSGALATSGTTVRRGPNGHHIIDPRSGGSAETPWRTVSVTAANCVDANTASTASIVLGRDAPGWLAERGLAARLVDKLGRVTTVGGWPAEHEGELER
jgi:thiamine biosynthesis lipoprotein